MFVEFDVGLGDRVLLGFPGGLIEGVGLKLGRPLSGGFAAAVFLFDDLLFDLFAHFEVRIARENDLDKFQNSAALHLAVGRFDESVVVDPRIAAQRRDQTDVRSFRSLDRADASVVRRMHVADFKSGSLAAQAARSKGRETPLMRDLRKRIGLIHELRQLAAAEKFPDGGHDRLGVDQVVRHGRGHFLVDRHLLLDRPLHADQADAELVFEQFTDGAHAAVAQVIDIVHARRYSWSA